MVDTLFFYIFAVLVVGGGVLTITRRNAVHSALWLIVTLLGTAGLFLLRKADFLFAVQIVLYIGGVVLLILFVVMLVNLDATAKLRQFNKQWWVALVAALVVGAELIYVLKQGLGTLQLAQPTGAGMAVGGNTERVADVLFSEYLLPFEVASLLLLVAIIGSVVMAKKRI